MVEPTEKNGTNTGRDAKGHFLPGNGGSGKGGRRKSEFRFQDIIDQRVSSDEWGEMVDKAKARALSDDPSSKAQAVAQNALEWLVLRRFGEPEDPKEKDATDRFFAFLAAIRSGKA